MFRRLYGHAKSLRQSNGDEWQRHRKIVAPVLNERIMAAVWDESISQTRTMLSSFTTKSSSTSSPKDTTGTVPNATNEIIEGVRTIAINVIGKTGYGTQQPWSSTQEPSPAAETDLKSSGYKLSFTETLIAVANNHILAVFVPSFFLCLGFLPKVVQTLGAATTEFPSYARDMIAEERRNPKGDNTLVAAMVKAADADVAPQKQKPGISSKVGRGLSEEEITGNLFNFTLAGFDTTAGTMAYAIMSLALEPKWQDWICEQVDEVARTCPDAGYQETFPKLTRCVALMVSSSPGLEVQCVSNGVTNCKG